MIFKKKIRRFLSCIPLISGSLFSPVKTNRELSIRNKNAYVVSGLTDISQLFIPISSDYIRTSNGAIVSNYSSDTISYGALVNPYLVKSSTSMTYSFSFSDLDEEYFVNYFNKLVSPSLQIQSLPTTRVSNFIFLFYPINFGFTIRSPVVDNVNFYLNYFRISIPGSRADYRPDYSTPYPIFIYASDENLSINYNDRLSCSIDIRSRDDSVIPDDAMFYVLPFLMFGESDYFHADTSIALQSLIYNSFDSGYKNALGQQSSYTSGYNAGLKANQDSIYQSGYNAGKMVSDKKQYNDGYNKGYSDGVGKLGPTGLIFSLFGAIADVPIHALNGLASLSIWDVSFLGVLFSFLFIALILWLIRKFL